MGLSSTTGLPATPRLLRRVRRALPRGGARGPRLRLHGPLRGAADRRDRCGDRAPALRDRARAARGRARAALRDAPCRPSAGRPRGDRIRRDRRRAVDGHRHRSGVVRVLDGRRASHAPAARRRGLQVARRALRGRARSGGRAGWSSSRSRGRARGPGWPSCAWPTSSRRSPRSRAAPASRAGGAQLLASVSASARAPSARPPARPRPAAGAGPSCRTCRRSSWAPRR